MKPRLVFVHGIGGLRDPAAELDVWQRALADGARRAGHSRRVLDLVQGWAADARFAYYGDLFGPPQAQGDAPEATDEDDTVAALLLESIDERLADPTPHDDAATLHHARAQLSPEGGSQGAGSGARQVLTAANTLLALPGLRTFGRWASAGLMVGQLRQVARYLRRGEPDEEGLSLDVRIRGRVEEALDPAGPTLVVAHSLGTVVALETLQSYEGQIPLLVTLGSPIGLRTAVRARMRPQPVAVPRPVARWLNFWDRDDLIVGAPLLEKAVRPNGEAVLPVSDRVDSNGAWVHPAVKYLAQPAVAGRLVEAIENATQP
ncbi:alpha/beta hydrolase [Streptomyces sp. NPDC005485]|uniref:alpha/beta hydrolase n=1 Tax=Streptomyces sp. NPDC005485 TaxID=3155591 RepID=UPI0033B5CCD5